MRINFRVCGCDCPFCHVTSGMIFRLLYILYAFYTCFHKNLFLAFISFSFIKTIEIFFLSFFFCGQFVTKTFSYKLYESPS